MIVVSLTTIPERLGKGLPKICINSILKQTIRPDYIIVNIPEISKKGERYSRELAKSLEQLSDIVKVQFGIQDLGPITKLVPTLDFIKNIENVSIILVDDDCIYDPSMIEILVTAKKKNPNELVIGTAGRIKQRNKLEFTGVTCINSADHIYVDMIETFAGVLYDYRLFKDTNFIDWVSKLPDFVMKADDIILSFWAKKKGSKLYKIIQNKQIVSHDPKGTVELNVINDAGGNNERIYGYFEDNELAEQSKNNSFAEFIAKINPRLLSVQDN